MSAAKVGLSVSNMAAFPLDDGLEALAIQLSQDGVELGYTGVFWRFVHLPQDGVELGDFWRHGACRWRVALAVVAGWFGRCRAVLPLALDVVDEATRCSTFQAISPSNWRSERPSSRFTKIARV